MYTRGWFLGQKYCTDEYVLFVCMSLYVMDSCDVRGHVQGIARVRWKYYSISRIVPQMSTATTAQGGRLSEHGVIQVWHSPPPLTVIYSSSDTFISWRRVVTYLLQYTTGAWQGEESCLRLDCAAFLYVCVCKALPPRPVGVGVRLVP